VVTRDDLLLAIVRADASVGQRQRPFFMIEQKGATSIVQPGLPRAQLPCEKSDVLGLVEADYLREVPGEKASDSGYIGEGPNESALAFDITDVGFARATELLLLRGEGVHDKVTVIDTTASFKETRVVEVIQTPPEIQAERKRLSKIAADFGWRIAFAAEPDGLWFWLVTHDQTDEPIKGGTAPTWQDALLAVVEDLVPPSDDR
jgi:hypothetical protein